MSTVHAFIQDSPKFRDAFEVVVHRFTTGVDGVYQRCAREVIPCANIGTARSVRDGILNGDGVPQPLPRARGGENAPNLELACGCLTGGLGHTPAVTWLLTGRVEQVHNWATARTLKRDYPPCEALIAGQE